MQWSDLNFNKCHPKLETRLTRADTPHAGVGVADNTVNKDCFTWFMLRFACFRYCLPMFAITLCAILMSRLGCVLSVYNIWNMNLIQTRRETQLILINKYFQGPSLDCQAHCCISLIKNIEVFKSKMNLRWD